MNKFNTTINWLKFEWKLLYGILLKCTRYSFHVWYPPSCNRNNYVVERPKCWNAVRAHRLLQDFVAPPAAGPPYADLWRFHAYTCMYKRTFKAARHQWKELVASLLLHGTETPESSMPCVHTGASQLTSQPGYVSRGGNGRLNGTPFQPNIFILFTRYRREAFRDIPMTIV